jgi:hypothetical protein
VRCPPVEEPALGLAQDHRDLRRPMWQPLAGAQEERNVFQRALIDARTATSVSNGESVATRSSSRYPGTLWPSTTPAAYCPRTSSSAENGRTAVSTSV